ncbi:MAG: sulfotransferase [Cyanobacteria bacterium J06634_6]
MKKKVLFIMGTAHCGSTLLTLVLGGHSQCRAVGEISNLPDFYRRGKPVCSLCNGRCSFWNERFSAADYQLLCGGLSEQRLHKYIPLKVEKTVRGMLKVDQVFNPYTLIGSRIEEQVIVDSTKTVYWLEKKLAAREFQQGLVEPYLLHLIRDGRAVMASYGRRKEYQGLSATEFGQRFGKMWQARVNNERRFFDQFSTQFDTPPKRLRYEEFATEPEQQAQSLCDWLGIPFEPSMLDYRNHENHVISGNGGTRGSTKAKQRESGTVVIAPETTQESHGIQLKQKWRNILSAEHIDAFYKTTDSQNIQYEWN